MHPSSPLVLDPEVLRGHNLGAIEETRLIRTSQVRLGVHLLSLRRCWDLGSRKAGRGLTEGQAFETVCDDYLERHDPLREAVRLEAKDKAEASLKGKALGTEDLVSSPRSRAIPAFTERSILREFGDRCMVEGCENRRFLDFAHIRPFRLGGRQVPANLIRFCKEHHVQFDEGSWRLAPTKDGGLVMISRAGTPVGRLRMASSHPPPTVPP